MDTQNIKKEGKSENTQADTTLNVPIKNAMPHKPVDVVSQPLKKAKSVNIKDLIKSDIESFKSQLQYYSGVCEAVTRNSWDPRDLIDMLNIFVRSLKFDAVSLLLLDLKEPGATQPLLSRGYKMPPNSDIIREWQEMIEKNGPSLSWNSLMNYAENPNTPLASWIKDEEIHRIAYVPLQDGKHILGVILVVSYDTKEPSPLSSLLLELLGGRLGLAIATEHARVGSEPAGPKIPQKEELKTKLSSIKNNMEAFKKPGKTVEDFARLADECLQALSESIKLLEY